MTLPYHPLANVFPLMEGREFTELVDDVKRHGLREPVVVLDGQILDGRNRMRACVAGGVEYRLVPFSGDDPVAFVVSKNLRRRHLDETGRGVVAARLETMRQGRPNKDANLHVLREDAAKLLNVSPRTVASAKKVLESGRDDLVRKMERGQITASRAEKEIRKEERQQQVQEIAKSVPEAGERYRLIHGPLTMLMSEPSMSVDVICTDPPYPEEFLPTFRQLSEVAAHLLRPGGVLLCMSGQSWLPEVVRNLHAADIRYLWTLAYLTPGGQATQVFPRKVNTFWKPVFVFVKGGYERDWYGDVCRSDVNDNDKNHHHWGQSISGMKDLMERFVLPGDVVVDPFLGGGTTAVVALKLGASFIGCDVDESAIATTKARIGGDHAAMVA